MTEEKVPPITVLTAVRAGLLGTSGMAWANGEFVSAPVVGSKEATPRPPTSGSEPHVLDAVPNLVHFRPFILIRFCFKGKLLVDLCWK